MILCFQAASQQAGIVSESGQWEQALALLTLAVRAVSEMKLQYLVILVTFNTLWSVATCEVV